MKKMKIRIICYAVVDFQTKPYLILNLANYSCQIKMKMKKMKIIIIGYAVVDFQTKPYLT